MSEVVQGYLFFLPFLIAWVAFCYFFDKRAERNSFAQCRREIQESNERWRLAREKEREAARIEEKRWETELQLKREAEAKAQEEFKEEAASRCNIPYLTKLCHTFIYYVDYIHEPSIVISDDDAFGSESAHFNPDGYFIRFRRSYILNASQASINNTMKHELIHAWQFVTGISPKGYEDWHDAEFCKKAAEIGVEYKRYQQPTQHLRAA